VKLLLNIKCANKEGKEAILQLFTMLQEIHCLGLTVDKRFVTRILPLVSGGVFTFLGGCLNNGASWEKCKTQLLDEFFPILFVKV